MQDKFPFCKAEECGVAVATSIEDNTTDGNSDKWSRLLIAVGYTRYKKCGTYVQAQ